MSEKFRLDRKIGFQNMFYTKCINVIIDSIGPSIILRSIYIKRERQNIYSIYRLSCFTISLRIYLLSESASVSDPV